MAIVPHFCQWLYATHFGTAIRESTYAFPIIETIHTLGIMVLVGTVSILDLRLLGVSMKQVPVSRLFSQILPWTWSGFVVMVITGILLFASEARDDYANNAFRLKLVLLLLVGVNPLIFHTTIFKSVQTWDLAKVTPLRARVAALLSLSLWAGIIVTGRLIAYAHN
jgi:multidrug transporter EmrE-like cation transporter